MTTSYCVLEKTKLGAALFSS